MKFASFECSMPSLLNLQGHDYSAVKSPASASPRLIHLLRPNTSVFTSDHHSVFYFIPRPKIGFL